MSIIEGILIVLIGFLIGLIGFGIFLHKRKLADAFVVAQEESKRILEGARTEADQLVKSALREGKEENRKRKKSFEDDSRKRKQELQQVENKLRQREQSLDDKVVAAEKRENRALEQEARLNNEEKKLLRNIAEYELAIERSQKTLSEWPHSLPNRRKRADENS